MNRIWEFIRYQLTAKNLHGTHSPFVYELYENVFDKGMLFYAFEEIDAMRDALLKSSEVIQVEDHGAGSKTNVGNTRKIKDIVKSASKPKKYGEFLFRLTRHLKVERSLELGTSVGLGSAYIAKATRTNHLTIEGSPEIHRIAEETFRILDLKINAACNTFENEIPKLEGKFDLIYIDGHHYGTAMLDYIGMLKPHLNPEGVFVLDDIRWSSDMHQAWKKVISDPSFEVTIDLFEMGLAFQKPKQRKEHFVLRY